VTGVPPSLRPGDVVAVVSPSGPLLAERLERGVRTLSQWGLDVQVMPHALDRTDDGLFAGPDEARAADFETAWCEADIRAVFCGRGGYGAGRLVDVLNWGRMTTAEPCWLVGSSDVTALHQAVARRLDAATLYGPMCASEVFAGDTPDRDSVEALRVALFEDAHAVSVRASPPLVIAPGQASAPLVGGNLALVASGIGTPDNITADGAIAFLEDVGEAPYRVDRMLTQLLRSGWFQGVHGVALGTFHQCGDVEHILRERLSGLGVPVGGGFPVGHGPVQHTVPLGLSVTLDASSGLLRVDR
jgi:muramoyltetrapeptide carboxypeptidase